MKLAEALVQRADSQKRLEQLRSRLLRNATVQEGTAPAEDPEALLQEYEAIATDLTHLIRRINITNTTVQLLGKTMTQALAERDILKQKHALYRDLAHTATITHSAVTRSEIRFKSTVNVATIQKQADTIAKALRELDTRIQEANWQIDLLA